MPRRGVPHASIDGDPQDNPARPGSTTSPEPPVEDGPVLVEVMAVGVCGTDHEIVEGKYGWAPPGRERLILGHESLGRVVEAPGDSGLKPGRPGRRDRPPPRPGPLPELRGRRVGHVQERQVHRARDQGARRLLLGALPDRAEVRREGRRRASATSASSWSRPAWWPRPGSTSSGSASGPAWSPKRVLVTGAGPIGLLAALMGVQRGLEVHVLDRATDGPKPDLVRDLGATYHSRRARRGGRGGRRRPGMHRGRPARSSTSWPDSTPDKIICLTGVSSGGRTLEVDAGSINRSMVLGNGVVFGSVNANRRHYEAAAEALAKADRDWLGRLITRRVPLETLARGPRTPAGRRQADHHPPRLAARPSTSTRTSRPCHPGSRITP